MSVSEENGSEGTGERREREETAGTAAEAPCAKKTRKECRRERRQARRAAAIERVQEEGVVTAEMLAETTYEFARGLRCVVPYAFTFSVHAKARWFGRALLDVWPREFGLTRAFCAAQLAAGRMRINGACAGPDAVLRAHDLVTNTVHRHEPPVVGTPVAVLAETPDLVVVNKPASLPVHPCGAFRHNSVLFVMAAEHGMSNLHPIHRLDRMTSGVLLMAKSTALATRYMKELQQGTMHKTYIARVVGCFPEGETTVDEPIVLAQEIKGRGFRNSVGAGGKPATTVFRRLLHDAARDESVVECRPLTGRTHQIRLHLRHLGHPIVNDPVYNDALYARHQAAADADTVLSMPFAGMTPEAEAEEAVPEEGAEEKEKKERPRPAHFEEGCPWCARTWRDPAPDELVMYLHALRYDGPGWSYATPMPDWALGATPTPHDDNSDAPCVPASE